MAEDRAVRGEGMDILINNIEMPRGDDIISAYIHSDGSVSYVYVNEDRPYVTMATGLPEHGELKNTTHIINELERQLEIEKKAITPFSDPPPGNAYMRKCRIEVLEWVICNIKNQPTIVEAST